MPCCVLLLVVFACFPHSFLAFPFFCVQRGGMAKRVLVLFQPRDRGPRGVPSAAAGQGGVEHTKQQTHNTQTGHEKHNLNIYPEDTKPLLAAAARYGRGVGNPDAVHKRIGSSRGELAGERRGFMAACGVKAGSRISCNHVPWVAPCLPALGEPTPKPKHSLHLPLNAP